MKWRKLMSGMLSAAMLVTSVTPVTADAEAVEEAAGKTVDGANLLAEFTFDGELAMDGGDAAILEGSDFDLAENGEGKAASFNGAGQRALIGKRADGSSLLAGREEITISFDVKPERSNNHDWVYFAAPDENAQKWQSEHYLGGLIHDNGNVIVERYNSTNQARPAAATGNVVMGEWSHINVVVEENQTTVYVNGTAGEAIASDVKLSDIVGDGGIFQLGKGNWEAGEYFKGQLDNFRVYDAALSAEAVARECESGEAATPTETPMTNVAVDAVVSVPYKNPYGGVTETAINDGRLASGTDTSQCWNSWGADDDAYPMPVTLTWEADHKLTGTKIMWWIYSDDGTVYPAGAAVEYLDADGETWHEIGTVDGKGEGIGGANTIWNELTFAEPVTTKSLRLLISRPETASGRTGVGISEWEVYGEMMADELVSAKISGDSRLTVDSIKEYTSVVVPAAMAEGAEYAWTVEPEGIVSIEGSAEDAKVTLKALEAGEATLKLTVTKDGVSKSDEMKVTVEGVQSIDTYQTSTAAGTAPILPDSVVANGLIFDDPTETFITRNNNVNLGESFHSRLIPVEWEEVAPESYAEEGDTFTVKGTATFEGKEFEAFAEITVKAPAAVAATNSSVTFENVLLNDAFWAPKQETNATTSLSKAIAEIQKSSGGEPNLDNAIRKLNGESYNAFSGFVFQDSDIYKSLEAISYTLSATQNDTTPEIAEQRQFLQDTLERWITKIEAVQYADGYIDTHFTLRSSSYSGGGGPGTHRWRYFANHEMYVAGHFLESVVAYTRYREGIGDPDYRLYVAGKRFADEIVSLFGPGGTRHEIPGHEEIELALVKFGKLAQEYEGEGAGQKYFDTAQTLIDRRGEDRNLRDSGYYGNTYSQDRTPFAEEVTARGHSVRAVYYWTAATDIAAMKEEENDTRAAYMNTLSSIWDAVENRKTYITGGIGTTAPSADSEGFGDDYVLPNAQSYCEICAAIGAANWNQRMNLLYEDGKYADVVERNLYNSILVGTNLDGNRFYYSTLLEVSNGNRRSEWFSCACCPPNLMRTIAALSGYMYNVHNDNLFVNMYVGSSGNVNVNGTNVNLVQETDYPWEGAVKLTVSPEAEKEFTLKVRVPGWVNEQKNQNVSIQVNGEAVEAKAEKGYAAITRTWKAGDVVMIDIPMEVRMTEANPKVETNIGRIALQRGPIVYCMENAGNVQLNPEIADFDVLNLVIPRDAKLTAAYNESLLNGVVELTGDVKYYNRKAKEYVDARMQAIPYYAWNNRGNDADYVPGTIKNSSSKMDIWAYADEWSGSTGLRAEAVPSVNYVGWNMGADNFADGSMASFWNGHNDPNLQTSDQWMMYDFGDQKAEISACAINFYDDKGGVRTPKGITIEYTDADGNWQTVKATNEWVCSSKTAADAADVFEFEPIVTSKIRVTMDHMIIGGSKVAVAVYEWNLTGELVGEEPPKPPVVPEVLADFDFDDEETGLTSEYGKAEGKHELRDSYAASVGKALYLDEGADTFLSVTNKDGGSLLTGVKEMTVSFEMKSDRTGDPNWPFYAAPNTNEQRYQYEHYIGLLENTGSLTAERFNNSGARAESNRGTANSTDWFRIDIVYTETGTDLYVNGEKQGETIASDYKLPDILGNSSILQIGKANWTASGEYFKGWIDNYRILSKALTAEEVKANADAFLNAKPADKTALEKKVNAAIPEDRKDEYTEESWKAYEDALNAAKAVLEKADATQAEVDEALKALTDAQNALKRVPKPTPTPVPADKEALQAAVDAAAAMKPSDYTADSWAALQAALQDAQAVLAKEDAAQAAVDAALASVNAAMEALVKAEPPKPPVDKIDHSKHIGMTFYAGDLKYKVTKDNGRIQEVRVTSLKNRKATKVVIPAKVTFKKLGETFKVTSIKAKAFRGTNIKKVVIGSNVTKIGPNAFLNCKKLTAVTIGKSVKSIGTRAFYGCTKLKTVIVRSKVLRIVKKNAFRRISRKAVIKVPKGKKKAYTRRFKGTIAKGVKIK